MDKLLSLKQIHATIFYWRCKGELNNRQIIHALHLKESDFYRFQNEGFLLLGVKDFKEFQGKYCNTLQELVGDLKKAELIPWPPEIPEPEPPQEPEKPPEEPEKPLEEPIKEPGTTMVYVPPIKIPTGEEEDDGSILNGPTSDETSRPRRWPIILAGLVLLIIVFFAFRFLVPTASPEPQETAGVADILATDIQTEIPRVKTLNEIFTDSFDNGLDPAWEVFSGVPATSGEVLGASELLTLYLGDSSWTDYVIEYDLIASPCNGYEQIIVGVRVQPNGDMAQFRHSSCAGVWATVISSGIQNEPQTDFRRQAFDYIKKVRITVQGNKFEVFEGTSYLDSADEFNSGGIMLRISPRVTIDNFKITPLP